MASISSVCWSFLKVAGTLFAACPSSNILIEYCVYGSSEYGGVPYCSEGRVKSVLGVVPKGVNAICVLWWRDNLSLANLLFRLAKGFNIAAGSKNKPRRWHIVICPNAKNEHTLDRQSHVAQPVYSP